MGTGAPRGNKNGLGGSWRTGIQRRRSHYRTFLYEGDYFVANHIGRFMEREISSVVMPGFVVCDMGCGEQPLRPLIESRGAVFIGVDVEQNWLQSVDIIANVTDVPLPDEYFDVVSCNGAQPRIIQ